VSWPAAPSQEGVARRARDAAKQAEFTVQVLEAKAQAYRAQEAAAGSGEAKEEAGRQAEQAEQAANTAGTAARAARAAANTATGAAANAGAEAIETERAAVILGCGLGTVPTSALVRAQR
jgi:hypothetical protein